MSDPLLEVTVERFQKWLHLPDPITLHAVLSIVAAHRLTADPVWLLIVGAPGSGKTELLNAVGTGIESAHAVGTLTPASLLSGTSRKERAKHAKGGLLKEIGDNGLLVLKDFGSILSMHRDARADVLAALREIYDGSWNRHVGSDGGQTLAWAGKITVLAGVTEQIDRAHAVTSSMGERFTLLRLSDDDRRSHARRSVGNRGAEQRMRAELAVAVRTLFDRDLPDPNRRSSDDIERVLDLAEVATAARSAVVRDYQGNLEDAPGSEVPTRLAKQLATVLDGADAIGIPPAEGWRLVARLALDSIPQLRRRTLDALVTATDPLTTTIIAEEMQRPTRSTRRALEDLAAHGVVGMVKGGQGRADLWHLTDTYRSLYADATRLTLPETSETPLIDPDTTLEDITGKVPFGASEPPEDTYIEPEDDPLELLRSAFPGSEEVKR